MHSGRSTIIRKSKNPKCSNSRKIWNTNIMPQATIADGLRKELYSMPRLFKVYQIYVETL
jgi:hypothetical protein